MEKIERDGAAGPAFIDTGRFSRERGRAAGRLLLKDLDELRDHAGAFVAGVVAWEAEGTAGRNGMPGAVLRVKGSLDGVCPRCGEPLTTPLDFEVSYLFARSEEAADAIPLSEDGDEEIAVASERLEVARWVGSEVAVRIPTCPTHESCSAPKRGGSGANGSSVNPFAALSVLRKQKNF